MRPYYDESGITIYHGDCLSVLDDLDNGIVDLVLTDPPYGTGTGERGDWVLGDFAGEFANAIPHVIPSCYRVSKPNGGIYAFTSWKHMRDWMDRCADFYRMQGFLIWDKGRHSGTFGKFSWQFHWEGIYYGLKGRREIRQYMPDVLRVDERTSHAMQKPVQLCALLIEASTDVGDVVLDPFMGSGSTLLAARQTGREAIGIEIDEHYCEIAVQRLAQEVLDVAA